METCWLLDHFALATLSIVIEDTNLVFLTGSIMISDDNKIMISDDNKIRELQCSVVIRS